MTNEERYKFALEEIYCHFDDQGFVHVDGERCDEQLVRYAGAVLSGEEKSLAEWHDELNIQE